MTIEEFVIGYLSTALSVPVSGDVPHPMPPSFVTVEKTGSGRTNKIESATLAVQSWAMSRAEAAALNETVKTALLNIITHNEISRSELDSDYNYTDEDTKRFRYQAVFDLVHFLGG